MNEISTIYFRAKGKGYGVFQSDSNNQKQMLMGLNNYTALSNDDNQGHFSKKNFTRDEDNKTSFKLKITGDCIKYYMRYNESGEIQRATSETMNMEKAFSCAVMAHPFNLLTGWMMTKNEALSFKRPSALHMCDFIQTNDAVPYMEGRSSRDLVTQNQKSFFYEETIGDVEYALERGAISIKDLQFMMTEENTCNASIPTDVETVNTFITMLKMNFPNSDFKDTYYKQLGSTGEKNIPFKGVFLDNNCINAIVRDFFKRLYKMKKNKNDSYFEVTEIEYKMINNPFDNPYDSEDGWVKINSVEDIDNISFECKKYFEEIKEEEMPVYKVFLGKMEIIKKAIEQDRAEKKAKKKEEKDKAKTKKKSENEVETITETENE